jgi:hypothetical protein
MSGVKKIEELLKSYVSCQNKHCTTLKQMKRITRKYQKNLQKACSTTKSLNAASYDACSSDFYKKSEYKKIKEELVTCMKKCKKEETELSKGLATLAKNMTKFVNKKK